MDAGPGLPEWGRRDGGNLFVAPSNRHGLGVYSALGFAKGELIEECPVLLIPAEQRPLVDRTSFSGYYYEWDDGAGGLALGFGSLYNHSYKPNARYDPAPQGGFLHITAVKAIRPGTEITINYNGSPTSKKRLWFDALD